MAAVHFTTIPFEPNTANYIKSYIYIYIFLGGGGGGRYPRFGVNKTFLCVFMSNFIVFMR